MATFPEWRALHRAANLIETELAREATQWESALFDNRTFAERSIRVLLAAMEIAAQPLHPYERVAFYESIREDDSPVGYLAPFLETTLAKIDKLARVNAILRRRALDEIELNTIEAQ